MLQFIRVRKFNMESVFESFEKFFIFRKKYERWCNIDSDAMTRLWDLYDSGFAYPLKERDDEGKRIIFVQAKKLDTDKFTSADAVRLLGLIATTLMEEEETQISGISTINDYTDVGYSFFKLFSMRDVKDFADCARNASVGREKENYFVNLPSFAAFLFEIGRRMLTDKMQQRLMTARDMDHLKTHIDSTLLPRELGGFVSELEMMRSFKKFYRSHEGTISEINDCIIDWESVEKKETCSVM